MSKFHTTVSRRDFMKALGFGAAGAVAAGASAPVFNDLDELTASAPKTGKPWWVKTRDFNDITTRVDWNVLGNRVDRAKYTPIGSPPQEYRTRYTAHKTKHIEENYPGDSLRDQAFQASTGGNMAYYVSWNGVPGVGPTAAGKQFNVSPEENFQTLRAQLHFIGASDVGVIEIDTKSQALLNKNTKFDSDTTSGYFVPGTNVGNYPQGNDPGMVEIVLPTTVKYMVVWTVQQNFVQSSYALTINPKDPSRSSIPNSLGLFFAHAYNDATYIENSCARFIQNLGWKAFSQSGNPLYKDVNVPFGIFAGLGELARSSMLNTRKAGVSVRRTCVILTDMPLAPTPPIDFGGVKFCANCKRCAVRCPSGAIPMETNPTFDVVHSTIRPGAEVWPMDWNQCWTEGGNAMCGQCLPICPFNHPNEGLIHSFVRATASAKISLLNGFYANMEEFMGYGRPKTEKENLDWWHRDYNTWKADTTLGGGKYFW